MDKSIKIQWVPGHADVTEEREILNFVKDTGTILTKRYSRSNSRSNLSKIFPVLVDIERNFYRKDGKKHIVILIFDVFILTTNAKPKSLMSSTLKLANYS